jgi:hypothetical protein
MPAVKNGSCRRIGYEKTILRIWRAVPSWPVPLSPASRCSWTERATPADNRPMTAEQAETLRRLAKDAYELDAFKPNLTRAEAYLRIAALTAKLKLLDEPPHTL